LSELIVVKAKFRETGKRFGIIREDSTEYRQAHLALNCMNLFPKELNRLYDTPEEALDFLHSREMKFIQAHRKKIEECQDK